MSIKISTCSLCCKNDLLFKFDFISKQIENSFFTVNSHLFSEDFIKDLELCTICAYKLQLSTQIKKQYDEMCNRNTKLSHFKCLFCEHKGLDIINLNKNPNQCQDKISVFMSSVVIQQNFKNLKSCLQCLYNLDVWFEIRSNLYKIMNIPLTNSSASDATNNNTNSTKTTPLNRSKSKFALLSTSSSSEKTPNSTNNKESKRRSRGVLKNTHLNKKKLIWCKYLNEKLKHLRTVDELVQKENLIISNIETEEDKLFNMLPFVEIFGNSQISKEKILQKNQNIATIVLSDTDDDAVAKRSDTRKRRLNLSLKKTDTPRNVKPKPSKARSSSKKKTFRFKMPLRSRASLKEASLSSSLDNSSVSSESLVEISSEDEPNNFDCKICDKNFSMKCDYLVHRLKHDKWEDLVVNLFRQNLPKRLDTTELSPKRLQRKAFSSPENINRLLTKWIGENAAKIFEEINNEKEDEQTEREEEPEQTETRVESANVEELKEPLKDKEAEIIEEENKQETDINEDAARKEEGIHKNNEEEMHLDTNTSALSEKDGDKTELIVEEELNEERLSKSKQNEEDENNPETEKEDENHSETEKKDGNDQEENNCILQTEAQEEKPSEKEGSEDNQSEEEKKLKLSQNKLDDENNKKETTNDNEKVDDVANKAADQGDKNDDDYVAISSTTNEEKPEDKMDDDTKSDKTNQCSSCDKENNEKVNSGSEIIDEIKKANSGSEIIDEIEKAKESVDYVDDSNSSDFTTPSIMTCEDLLNILETNIDDDNVEPGKRKREASDSEATPKRKKVRFAEEKEIFTRDKSGVLLEKVIETDQFVPDREDGREKEGTVEA